jgi:REP element-mobilizing transposase RayT
MSHPLVIAHHLIWTSYGWWLPNDPRGSGSSTIRNDILSELGELDFGRKKAQPSSMIVRQFYEKAADLLKHALLAFDEQCRNIIGQAFAEVIEERRYTIWACAIMPDHVHIVIRKHKDMAEEMVKNLMALSRQRLIGAGQRPPDHPTWTVGYGWKVFLDHPDEVRRTTVYVEQNPIKIHLPAQRWPFVKAYDDWPLHSGHSTNSPYARRLRAAGRYPD